MQVLLNIIDGSHTNSIETWHSDMWIMLLGIEHERIHLETSAVIMRRVPLELIRPIEGFIECPSKVEDLHKIPINQMVTVPAWKGVWERNLEKPMTYGWDN